MIKVTFIDPDDSSTSYTSDNLNFIVMHREIGAAEPKTNYVEIPGSNTCLDLTEIFGHIYYNRREIDLDCMLKLDVANPAKSYDHLEVALNGKEWKIVFSDDDEKYYQGRVTVGDYEWDDGWWKFEIEANCEPKRGTL